MVDFNYIVVPTTNFAAGAANSSVTVSNMAIAIRLQGVASSNIEYSKANLDLFGIYLASDFTSGEVLLITSTMMLILQNIVNLMGTYYLTMQWL